MKKLLKDRVKLFRSIDRSIEKVADDTDRASVRTFLKMERTNDEAITRFLSYSQDDPAMVSYSPGNNRRVKTKLGRYIQKFYPALPISQRGLHSLLRASFCFLTKDTNLSEFQIVKGDDIVQAYKEAIGGWSCMTGDGSKYTEMYAMNPDIVSMVIYNKCVARALLWYIDGDTIMDRIYPNDGNHVFIMQEWAKDQGYAYRLSTSCPGSGTETLSNEHIYTFKMNYDRYFPYMDTFRYGRLSSDGRIALSNSPSRMPLCLDYTDGGPERQECALCGDECDDQYEFEDSYYCESCWSIEFSICDRCTGTMRNEDAQEVGDGQWCEFCVRRYAVSCKGCGELIPESTAVSVREEDSDSIVYYCEECSEELSECVICGYKTEDYTDVGGKNYCHLCLNANCSECIECGDWYEIDDLEHGTCPKCRKEDDDEQEKTVDEPAAAGEAEASTEVPGPAQFILPDPTFLAMLAGNPPVVQREWRCATS